MAANDQQMTSGQRIKISLLALGFFIGFAYLFTLMCAAGIFGEVFRTSWEGTGWVVADYWSHVIRGATTGEVLHHKSQLLSLALFFPLSIFWLYIFVQSVRGRKTALVAAILNRMEAEKGQAFGCYTSVVDLREEQREKEIGFPVIDQTEPGKPAQDQSKTR
jgi:hypothetical protein